MKKLIALSLAILLVLTMTGCAINAPPDNKYVAMAKEYGYWHGMGGISWGMSIDETLEVLNLTKEDTIPIADECGNSQISIEGFSVNTTIFGRQADMRLTYGKVTDKSVTALAEKEWLIRIEVVFEKEHRIETLTARVQERQNSQGLSYDEKEGKWENKQSLNTLSDKEQGTKAIEIYKNVLAILPDDATYPETFLSDPIDRIVFSKPDEDYLFKPDNNYLVHTISYTGYAAAILAKSH